MAHYVSTKLFVLPKAKIRHIGLMISGLGFALTSSISAYAQSPLITVKDTPVLATAIQPQQANTQIIHKPISHTVKYTTGKITSKVTTKITSMIDNFKSDDNAIAPEFGLVSTRRKTPTTNVYKRRDVRDFDECEHQRRYNYWRCHNWETIDTGRVGHIPAP